MQDGRLSSSALALLANGVLVLVLSLGGVACGGETDRPEPSGASGGGTGMSPTPTVPETTGTEGDTVGPGQADTASEEVGPTPLEGSEDLDLEEAETDEGSPEEGASEDAETDPESSQGTSPPAPDPEPERNTLEVVTDPGEATVTIENQETGRRRTKETPATFEVPPGLYAWTVEKDGYASKNSRQAIDLTTQSEYEERVDLVSVSGEGAYRERAGDAYRQENYQRAIGLYEQVPEPSAEEDPSDYLRAQGRLGRIYWKQRENYAEAIQAYQNIIEYDDTRYEAFLNLARIHFESNSYGKALKNLDRVNELKYRIPAQDQKRQRTSLQVRYLRGRTLFQLAKNERTRNRRAKALRANQSFRGFLNSIPPELESTFSQEIKDAQQKKKEVRTLLREELK